MDSTPEYKFGRDLIRYVMQDYYLACNWKPEGIFLNEDEDSPFTLTMRKTVDDTLEKIGHKVHEYFDMFLPSKDINRISLRVAILESTKAVFADPFNCTSFISYMVYMAEYAAISYIYGYTDSPYDVLDLICEHLAFLQYDLNWFPHNGWEELQKYCVKSQNSKTGKLKIGL